MAAIVFIHLGPHIPQHTAAALAQVRVFNTCPIFMLGPQAALTQFNPLPDLAIEKIACESLPLSPAHQHFHQISRLDRTFREGFWTSTTERFFYLESFLAQRNLQDVVHLENDVMLYVDVQQLLGALQQFPALAGTFDNDHRCVAGLLYVRQPAALTPLNHFINSVLEVPANARVNDMLILGAFGQRLGPQAIAPLPIVTPDYARPLAAASGIVPRDPTRYTNAIERFDSIFDAAALGQYLGGIDPRNTGGQGTVGFINESCVFNPSLYTYHWHRDSAGRRVPYLRSPARSWRINNLHIHSKNLGAFASIDRSANADHA